MIAHIKTLAAAIVTMLIGPSFAASAEIQADPSEERTEAAAPADDDTPNIMGDIL